MLNSLKLNRSVVRKQLIGIRQVFMILFFVVSLMGMSSTIVQAADPLVGYWAFNDGTGSTAVDSSSYGNNGTVYQATWTTRGFGGALSFDGVNDYVWVPDSSSLSLNTNQATFAAWIKADALTANWIAISQRANADLSWYDWQIYARALDAPTAYHPVCRFDWNGDNKIDSDEQVEGDIILQPNTWYFIACTYDGTAIKFYIDGTLRNTTAKVGGVIDDGGQEIRIGGNEPWGEYFDGVIDEVRIYNAALSQAEIQALMGTPQYTLTTNTVGNGHVTLDPTGGIYNVGTVVQLTAVADPGWTFAGWSGNLSGTTNPASLTMDTDKTVTATFTQDQYTLTVNIVGNGTVTKNPDQATYTYGTSVQLTATADPGWTFAGWSDDLSGTTNPESITMNGNRTVTATFTQDAYTLTVNVVGNGAVTKNPDQATYAYGTSVQLSATADPGWTFAGWSGDLSGTTNPESITMNGNRTVTATFTQDEYTLTVNVVGNGAVTKNPDQTTYTYGTSVQLTATADPGWAFAGWSGDLSGTTTPESITMNGNRTVTATFTELSCYALNLDHTGNGTDPVATPTNSTGCVAGEYHEGEVISLSGAVADVGYRINNWTGTDNDASKAATNTVTMPAGAHTATVNYVAITTPIPVSPTGTVNGIAKPDFIWNVFPGATSYKLAVWSDAAQAYVVQSTVATSLCNATQCSFLSPLNLANGSYKFKVMAYITGGSTPYSDWLAFTIAGVIIPPPATPPTLIAPNTTVDTHRPTFQWNAVTDATFYRLAVYSYDTKVYVVVENVYPTCTAGVCSYTPTTWDLVNGSYGFKMRSRNSSGYTDFGTMMKFSVSSNLPVAPTLIAPTGTVVTNPPTFEWNEVSGATRYRLLVYSVASGSYVINTYVLPSACSGGVCTYTPASAMASGSYKFKMSTENSYGVSGYSGFRSFTVP